MNHLCQRLENRTKQSLFADAMVSQEAHLGLLLTNNESTDLAHFESMHLRVRLFFRFEQYDVFLAPEHPIV